MKHINSRLIKWIFVLSCLIAGVFYCLNYRTSSKDRLEKASEIRLPKNFKVLKDKYQDMLQDYCIVYEIQFDSNATSELIRTIKASKLYNLNVNPNEVLSETVFVETENGKAVWCKSEKGFRFSKKDERTFYNIELDTLTNILRYDECSD